MEKNNINGADGKYIFGWMYYLSAPYLLIKIIYYYLPSLAFSAASSSITSESEFSSSAN